METKQEQRRLWLRELRSLEQEVNDMENKITNLELHDGDDGTPEDIDEQCRLVDAVHEKQVRMRELRRLIYPKIDG